MYEITNKKRAKQISLYRPMPFTGVPVKKFNFPLSPFNFIPGNINLVLLGLFIFVGKDQTGLIF